MYMLLFNFIFGLNYNYMYFRLIETRYHNIRP